MGIYTSAAVVAAIAIALAGMVGYAKGAASRNPEIAELRGAILAAESLARESEERAKAVSERVVVQYRDRVRTITEQRPAEIQLVEVIRAESNPPLSPSFRLLHDSAATGSQAAENPGGTDAAPVPVADAAETVAANYATCRTDQARLAALQEIIRSQ